MYQGKYLIIILHSQLEILYHIVVVPWIVDGVFSCECMYVLKERELIDGVGLPVDRLWYFSNAQKLFAL